MFKTTKKIARTEYDRINQELFNGLLPPVKFKIKKHPISKKYKCWAYHQNYKIVLKRKYPSYMFFRDVLAHEMVHVWQDCIQDTKAHGYSFYLWKAKFSKFGYPLNKSTGNWDDYDKC